MATSQDKAQKIKEAFRGKGPQIFMGVMALLLAARIFFFMQENGSTPPPLAAPQVKVDLPSAIKPETDITGATAKVNKMLNPLPDFTTTTYYALARVNMFDAQAAQKADSLINRANQFVVQAQAAYDRQAWAEAQMMVKEALLVNPSQTNALVLRSKIETVLKVAATSATLAAAGAAPAPPAVPGATPAPGVPGATPTPATPAP